MVKIKIVLTLLLATSNFFLLSNSHSFPFCNAYPDVTAYYPSGYNLIGNTQYVSGWNNLQADDTNYTIFRSYASRTSPQTLYAHQETTIIGGVPYYIQRLESADAAGTSLTASMDTTGRKLWGRFIYPLIGVSSIPASAWTIYYRTWQSVPSDVSVNSPSSTPAGTWTNPTYAYGSDNLYASSTVDKATQEYGNYGFSIPATAIITKVEVGFEAYTAADEKIGITVSWNNGTTWATEVLSGILPTSDPNTVTWVDFTAATSWTPEKLSNANFRARAKGVKVGAMSTVYLDWIPARVTYTMLPSAHADVDVLIREFDGTVRTTIATDVAGSANLTTTPTTRSGSFSSPAYTVVNQTDYIEMDYYVDVVTAKPGATAYLRIDDKALAMADQTRATNIMLPSEYTIEVEFTGSSNIYNWTQLVWTVDSAWTIANATIALQLYNYTLGGYPTGENGYVSYTSSSTPNTDETRSQRITTNPTHFRNSTGGWKIKVKGVKLVSSAFEFKADFVKFDVTPVHDVAIISVSPSRSCVTQSQTVIINVVAKNEGGVHENFTVTAYYLNTTGQYLIGTLNVTNLGLNENKTLAFTWNTQSVKPCQSYIIMANATIVPGETITANNSLEDGIVKIKIAGDVNGDGAVKFDDLFALAAAYGSRPGDPNWNLECDFDDDGRVGFADLFALAANYGRKV